MTEKEWLECTDPNSMLRYLEKGASERKLRLFACGCCRRTWHLLVDERSRTAVEVAEKLADGLATASEVEAAEQGAGEAASELAGGQHNTLHCLAANAAEHAIIPLEEELWMLELVSQYAAWVLEGERLQATGAGPEMLENWAEQCSESGRTQGWTDVDAEAEISLLVRDIFGNPFRPVHVDPTWLTPDVLALAQAIYDERRFADLPILGDALEEAGCTSDEMLNHCREGGDHARGCWVVDLLLAKE